MTPWRRQVRPQPKTTKSIRLLFSAYVPVAKRNELSSFMRITSITPMKNEGPYILEWVAYHRSIGFNDMLVFQNDCEDGTDLILERLDEMGLVRHMPNQSTLVPNPRHHILLVRYVNLMPRLRRSDWVIHLDADEFVRVKPGDGHVSHLFAALPDVDAISLSLHSFGCNGHERIAPDGELLTETYTRRSPATGVPMAVKYLARGAFPWTRFPNNSPEVEPEGLDTVKWVNGSGHPLPQEVIAKPFKALKPPHNGTDLVDVAHYAVRSFDGFLMQKIRGNANPLKGQKQEELRVPNALKYWNKFNRNDEVDTLLQDRAPLLREALDILMNDAELRALHEASVKWHRDRVEELRKQTAFRRLNNMIHKDHEAHMAALAGADGPDPA